MRFCVFSENQNQPLEANPAAPFSAPLKIEKTVALTGTERSVNQPVHQLNILIAPR